MQFLGFLLLLATTWSVTFASPRGETDDGRTTSKRTVSSKLFTELEESSRLVSISYCVGYQGITEPFECLGHCADFEGFELVDTWDSGLIDSASCGYMALSHRSTPPRIILAFRGSNSLSDAVSDLLTLPAEYTPYEPPKNNDTAEATGTWTRAVCDGCKVHAGFLYAWQTTRDKILPILRDTVWKYPGYDLVLVGHSLGGAIAGLAALEFASMGWNPTVTTFGEPRFGNQELAEYTDTVFGDDRNNHTKVSPDRQDGGDRIGRYRRVTHADDPVPLYPLEDWGWRMHSGEIYIAKTALPPSKEDLLLCAGQHDPQCIEGASTTSSMLTKQKSEGIPGFPAEWKLWEILFAHREYFWRLGLCWDPQSGGYPKSPKNNGLNEL